MKPRLRPSLVPQCSSCIRSLVDSGLGSQPWRPLIQQQTRGAKTNKTADTIPVVLLKDKSGFGKKGTFIPMKPGTMRNEWFPGYKARYATFDERRAIKRGEIECARDYQYIIPKLDAQQVVGRRGSAEDAWRAYLGDEAGTAAASLFKTAEGSTANEAKVSTDIKIKHIEPRRAIEVLENLLPETLVFERRAVPKPEPENKSKLPASVQAMLKANLPEERTPIFGSVSTTDIANHIRESVSYNDEAASIQMGEANVKFINLPAEDDPARVKHLGHYLVEISFRGSDSVLTKKVNVSEPREDGGSEKMVDPALTVSPADELLEANNRAVSS